MAVFTHGISQTVRTDKPTLISPNSFFFLPSGALAVTILRLVKEEKHSSPKADRTLEKFETFLFARSCRFYDALLLPVLPRSFASS